VNVLQLSLLHSCAHKILHILSTPKQLIRVTIFVSCHSCDSSLRISDQEYVNSSVGLRQGRRSDLSNYGLFYHRNVWGRLKFVSFLKTNFLNFTFLSFSVHANNQIRISFSNHLNRWELLKDKELINKCRTFKSDCKAKIFCKHSTVGTDINSGMR